ncbi:hypothetical protein GJ654_16615 [Rhodoblastus acidophilus]|jgi:hypothetical protein|uniref:Uncharacterized protein n=1 Tax=Rhodoblastus acidophilus TaxID=1074 RepID=A0A6N8DTZ0_RHOAC|nr:hypothetical protein [Rhodoblastus acidophilus]MCW2275937.1 hypothetical protein [Rhodoblastus acidophilus]MTV32611.1 hypothetical protein [Rhodoblastus acidophilus]
MQDNRDKFNRILGMICSNEQTGADRIEFWCGFGSRAAQKTNHRAAGVCPASHDQVSL